MVLLASVVICIRPGYVSAQGFDSAALIIPIPAGGRFICLPPRFDGATLDSFADRLQMGDAQQVFARSVHASYLENYERIIADNAASLSFLSIQSGQAFDRGHTPSAIATHRLFIESQEAVASELIKAEDELLARLTSCLQDEQLAQWPRLADLRRRIRCRPHPIEIHAARMDLSRLIPACGLNPSAREALEPIILEYEQRITPLFAALDDEHQLRAVDALEAFSKSMFYEDATSVDTSTVAGKQHWEEWFGQYRKRLRREATQQRAIAEMNQAFMSRMLAAIEQDQARLLREAYRLRVFSKIHVDSGLMAVEEAMRSLEPVLKTPEMSEAWEVTLERYRSSSEAASARMEAVYLEWCLLWVETKSTIEQAKFREYLDRMWVERRARWRAADQFINEIRQNWPPDAVRMMDGTLRFAEQAIAAMKPQTIEDWPGTGP